MQLILVGGFLGSGKTTAIQQACEMLIAQQKKVAVITNDQGNTLVDSKFISSSSIPVKEVVNGCFCCNYNDLLQNIYYFSEHINPDYIFAESVGSCTDIIATIAKPLAEMHPELSVSISVFVDAYLLNSLIKETSSFIDDSVRYIFKKQIEEADILILNKIDLLDDNAIEEVLNVLNNTYLKKKIFLQNSFNQQDIETWLNNLNEKNIERKSLDIDYNIYGEGEAKLAWLDAELSIQSKKLSSLKVATQLAEIMLEKIKEHYLTIGHVKFFFDDGNEQVRISYTTTMQHKKILVNGRSQTAFVVVNARVQTEPEVLKNIFNESIKEAKLKTNSMINITAISAFQPGYPTPTYRLS